MSLINMEIVVVPTELSRIFKFVWEELLKLENKINSKKHGFIEKILCIHDISFDSICHDNHDGAILFNVKFKAECTNPKKGDIIKCKIIQTNDMLFSFKKRMHILIRPNSENVNLKNNEIVSVLVVETELDVTKNIIKVLADLIINNA